MGSGGPDACGGCVWCVTGGVGYPRGGIGPDSIGTPAAWCRWFLGGIGGGGWPVDVAALAVEQEVMEGGREVE
eukprot:8674985-Ditylum_brightwellii.AAC.1